MPRSTSCTRSQKNRPGRITSCRTTATIFKVKWNIRRSMGSRVTLDPNTAHQRIALSAENTEISTSVEIRDVLDNPGPFDVNLAILGTIGFSSGRHYWEVSVAEKLCYHLGMASESSQRKGAITFNPTNGFWTIVLNKRGQYTAVDRRDVLIPVQMQPLTFGILLDYKKGQNSFYDAGRRSHMYSFVG